MRAFLAAFLAALFGTVLDAFLALALAARAGGGGRTAGGRLQDGGFHHDLDVEAGAASFDSTVARAGVWPGTTQASQASFISAHVLISVSQILALRILVLSVPACFSVASIWRQDIRGLFLD